MNKDKREGKKKFTITKRNGETDITLENGMYLLDRAIVHIEKGLIVGIDNGQWRKL